MLFVLSLLILDGACDTADYVLEDAFDENCSETVEIIVGFGLSYSLGQIFLRRGHILEYFPLYELLGDALGR